MKKPRMATTMGVASCECCGRLSVKLMDAKGNIFAAADLEDEDIPGLVEHLLGYLADIDGQKPEHRGFDA